MSFDAVISAARNTSTPARIEGVRITPGDYRLARLVNVEFEDVDLSGVRIWPPILRRGVLEDCTFRRTRWDQMTLQRFTISGCAFVDFAAKDLHLTDCEVERSHMTGASITRATFEKCRLVGVRFENLRADRPFFDRCDLKDSVLSGEASVLVMPSTTRLKNVDLSSLRMRESAIDSELTRVTFPAWDDCFVVPRAGLYGALPALRGKISSGALGTYEAFIGELLSPYWVIDRTLFAFRGLESGAPLSDDEIDTLLAALYLHRVGEVEYAPATPRMSS